MIRWLHISDLHSGQTGYGGRWSQFREAALADIRQQVAIRGVPDLIFFTGDLAFSGEEDEYVNVETTLNDIREALGNADPLILPVPGNHDLRRPTKWPLTQLGLQHYYPTLKKDFVLRNGEIHEALGRIFLGYTKWWTEHVEKRWIQKKVRYQRGLYPGDFRLGIEIEDINLAVVGLNSAIRHFDNAKNPDLAIEIQQCGHEFERWVTKFDAALLAMHHPMSWLEREVAQRTLKNDIYPKDRFVACLYGHMHEPDVELDGPRRWLQGSSLFGLEHFGTSNESRISGYSWGSLERASETSGRLSQWVRQFATDKFVSRDEWSFQNVDVPLRAPPPAGTRKTILLLGSDVKFRSDVANALDTYVNVSRIDEIDPASATSDQISNVDQLVLLLSPTTLPSAAANSLHPETSLVLRTPGPPPTDPATIEAVKDLQTKHSSAQQCDTPEGVVVAVQTRLRAVATQLPSMSAIAPPLPAQIETSLGSEEEWGDVDKASEEGMAAFDDGQIDEAKSKFQLVLAMSTAKAVNTPDRGEYVAKTKLDIASCLASEGKYTEAEAELSSLDLNGVRPSTRVRLVTFWASLGNTAIARELLSSLDPTDAQRIDQLIALREGKLPESLDPSLKLDSLDVLVSQGRLAEAADIAMGELDASSE